MAAQRLEAVGMAPWRRHRAMAAWDGSPRPGNQSKAMAADVGEPPPSAMAAKPPEAWIRIKASLRAFQRWEVKLFGFGVKARPRPQRMALRWFYSPLALVGAIGEACGEAPGASVFGAPPCGWGALFPWYWESLSFSGHKKSAPCGALRAWRRLVPGGGCRCGRDAGRWAMRAVVASCAMAAGPTASERASRSSPAARPTCRLLACGSDASPFPSYTHSTPGVKSACREDRSHRAFVDRVHPSTGFIY